MVASLQIIDGYTTPGTERETRYRADQLLADMDAAGVARAVIAPQDREIAVDNAAGNRRLLAMARKAGGRLLPTCTVNPWRGEEGLRLLREAADDGARMLVLSGALQGFLPVDELAAPLLALAGELGLPVFFHTGPHSHGAPSQVVLAAQRHPATRFVLGHCGATDHGIDMPAIVREHVLPNLWFDLGYFRPWATECLMNETTADRLIWASGVPRNVMSFELAHCTLALPAERYPGVYGGNLTVLLEGGDR